MFECEKCGTQTNSVVYRDSVRMCRGCYALLLGTVNPTSAVIGDECDVYLNHGLCNEDGSPKRWRSKSAIKQAAFEKGLFQGGDTPKVNPRLQEARARQRES